MLDSAGENIAFTNLAGSHNLTLAEGIGAGATTFTGTVSNLGSGSGAALTIEESVTGLVDFQGSLATNSGITATDTNVQIKMDGPTTLGDGNTGTVINGDLTLGPNCTLLSTFDGLFVDELIVAAGANPLSLASNNNSSTFVSAVDFGGRDLTITSGARRSRAV